MLSFELDKTKTALQIFADEEGIEQMTRYLKYIKRENSDIDLISGAEIERNPIGATNNSIPYVNIRYISK